MSTEVNPNFWEKPVIFGALYLLSIPVYAIFYFYTDADGIPKIDCFDDSLKRYGHSIYFSVVTLTTLGYGDISPASLGYRILSASQAIYGVLMIGLFLNALAHKIAWLEDRKKDPVRNIAYGKMHTEVELLMPDVFHNETYRKATSVKVEYAQHKVVVYHREDWQPTVNEITSHNEFTSIYKQLIAKGQALQNQVTTAATIPIDFEVCETVNDFAEYCIERGKLLEGSSVTHSIEHLEETLPILREKQLSTIRAIMKFSDQWPKKS